ANEMALHLLPWAVALGDDPNFSCPLPIPPEIRKRLVVVKVPYLGFDGDPHLGQQVVDREVRADIRWIFLELFLRGFPIASMVPSAAFEWSDERSMVANNTSTLNYRYIAGTNRLSMHAYGRATDINPVQNPCYSNGVWTPPGARYDPSVPGTITADSIVVALFRSRGWCWGGNCWENGPFDPQHFFKPFSAF
ncbi:MAG: M15 family metallopeptidase, partial [Candidatus Moraniibacteriota bacterium]